MLASPPKPTRLATGNVAFVKAVAVNAAGEPGPVTEVQQSRPIGPFHKDNSSRPTSGTGEQTLETIQLPAGVLGTNGMFSLEVFATIAGTNDTKFLSIEFGATTIVSHSFAASETGDVLISIKLVNVAGFSAQDIYGFTIDETPATTSVELERNTASENTAVLKDVDINGQVVNAGDTVTLGFTMLELRGTD